MQLIDNHPLGTVNNKRPPTRHVGQVPQIHYLLDGLGIIVRFPGNILNGQPHFGFEGHSVGESAFAALAHTVLGFVHIVFHKIQDKIFPAIHNGERSKKNRLQAFYFSLVRRHILLQKFPKRFPLNIQKIRIFNLGGNF